MSGSGISWAICKFAPHSRQITMPAPHHSVFYRPDALPATQPTASKHWRQSIERHWNRNKVSWESSDKEVNRRPTSLRAHALRGPRVSIATGWNIKSGGREEYLVSFLTEAVSAVLPAEWDVECRYESARVLTTITSHVRGLPTCHGINVSPSGRLPSSLAKPTGSLVTGTPAAVMARLLLLLYAACKTRLKSCRQSRMILAN